MFVKRAWFGGMRVRILAVVVLLLLASSIGSMLLLRVALLGRLDDEVAESLDREAEEFRLLSRGNDPRTGEPFDGNLPAIFDVYFSREVPDEGESLLGFVDGELYASIRAQDAAGQDELSDAINYWLSLEEEKRGTLQTSVGPATYVALPLSGQDQDGLFVLANFPAFERNEIIEALRVQALVAALALAVAAVLGALLAGRVLRPLVNLAGTARRISETDLTQRIPVRGRDEASLIAQAFNDMLGRLEGVFAQQRQFLNDTSHELRTPLTIIRGQLELLELDETPEARRETIELVTEEVDRMSRMVDELFLLARAEQPDFLRREPILVSEFVTDLHHKLTTLAPVALRIDVTPGVTVLADRHRLTQAILQLVANAVKHAGASAWIEFRIRTDGEHLVLVVADNGPGVAPRDEERIFDRGSRGTPETGGAGLGLVIVRAIADAHGGTVRVLPNMPRGTCAEMRVPLAR